MKKSSLSISKINDYFWSRVLRSTESNSQSLSVFRIIAGVFLLIIYTNNYAWIGEMPNAFFMPPILSPANLLTHGFPPKEFFWIMDFALILTALCITLGVKARVATIIHVLISVICINYASSFGKIGHNIFLYLLLGCMSFSGWGTRLAIYPDKEDKYHLPAKSLSILSILLCFGFFSAGCEKALNWINFDLTTSGTAKWFYNSYFNFERTYFLASSLRNAPFWIFKAMDFAGVILELSPLFFLLHSRKSWQLFLVFACCFHLTNVLFFNISFINNGLVYLAFMDYTSAFNYLKKILSKKTVQLVVTLGLALIVALRIDSIIDFSRSIFIFLPPVPQYQMYGILFFWLIILGIILRNLIKTTPLNSRNSSEYLPDV
ncbi:hypothetical protein DJ568_02015 [Mucilaginibacter hurinus]|uniref:HTTM domain-containing protein n=1 Tax=Mucilaginibacter hurinus TaxID=2201324 RepID=A0A367GTP7_9SPHI|nr:hypothetical protein [Mucilaginibacter hurinus]RCH56660.1 hypothetical protein DJ568_02015 [Mucilaginibacter hurinus]